MYICNPTAIQSPVYKTKRKIVKEYLIKQDLSLLSQDESGFYFSETTELKEVLDKAPIWIRLFK